MSSSSQSPVIVAEDLGVRFGSLQALDRVSFTLSAGSIMGLVGPNGAGKTTLIRILATLLLPTSGRAAVSGVDVVDDTAKVRGIIGYLPDFPGLYQDMRVEEYLLFFADAHGLAEGERGKFVSRALELSGLRDRSKSFIEELSRGMRSKLSFVRALAGDPKILLLDEPLSNLDPVARSDMLAIILAIKDEGKSILVSSHIISDLEKICDRVLFIHGGRLIKEPNGEEGGGQDYLIRLRGGREPARENLRQLDGVETLDETGDENCFMIRLGAAADPAKVLKAAVDSGLDVIEWRPAAPSLEERLVKAVKGGDS